MRPKEWVLTVLAVVLMASLIFAWTWILSGEAYHVPKLVKNAYYPFTVEIAIRDR